MAITKNLFLKIIIIYCITIIPIFFIFTFLLEASDTKIDNIFYQHLGKRYLQRAESSAEDMLRLMNISSDMALGEMGGGAYLPKYLKAAEEVAFKRDKFNSLLSNYIPLNRTLHDYRIPECKELKYPYMLPSAAVVLVFCDEPASVVLRTIHSVVNRSPAHHLLEVILVDDASTRDDLGIPFERYIKATWRSDLVKLFRSKKRLGLINARLQGARLARADVLVFLDSHCEASQDWIQPLLFRISENRKIVVCPLIDTICARTFRYTRSGGGSIGGFSWNLNFEWRALRNDKRKKPTDPIKSPTMAGGLFAIERNYFFEIGGYDEGMNYWGGENLEISYRIWMCGGRLEFIPCSRVGHIFRRSFPYSLKGARLELNLKRLADVWMDEYKRYFYLINPRLLHENAGNISERLNLRKRLNCKSFKWYMNEVYPEKFIPHENVRAYGMIQNRATNLCLDSMGQDLDNPLSSYSVNLYGCQDGKSLNQLFSLTKENSLRKEDNCLSSNVYKADIFIASIACTEKRKTQLWKYDKETSFLIFNNTLCLDIKTVERNKKRLILNQNCSTNNALQRWTIENWLS